ncbi:MepB family protein [Marivirga salinae]|uniref:MepB family protein n=1 Tax=Marivirga salinarum TaxID=3059078 RepID=A0AA49JH23_9BACT|nr:MepB family protein [Marivirga sp. BDSF4-3]WKK77639.2 MepB family protein [Marivirga sp. BDSF4-3]
MNQSLKSIQNTIYNKCGLALLNFKAESESKEYDACQFKLNGLNVISRSAKVTPKKAGQFVTFWKRNGNGPIEPFHESDPIDFFVVNIQAEDKFGQFVFPKSVLIKKGVISTNKKEGKRAIRVYPIWDIAKSKQAIRTQKWQIEYFYEIGEATDLEKVKGLYGVK